MSGTILVCLLVLLVCYLEDNFVWGAVCKFQKWFFRCNSFIDAIAPRQSKNASSKNSDTLGTGRATLRLRSKGPAVVEEVKKFVLAFFGSRLLLIKGEIETYIRKIERKWCSYKGDIWLRKWECVALKKCEKL